MKHQHRDSRTGRWATTPSGAPIPNADGSGADPIAYDGPLSDPNHSYPEFSHPYPAHDPSYGGYQRLISHRRQVVVDGETGEQLDAHITDVRAADRLLDSQQRLAAHLAWAEGDPFATNLMSAPVYDFHSRSRRHMGSSVELPNERATHTAWPGESGEAMRDR